MASTHTRQLKKHLHLQFPGLYRPLLASMGKGTNVMYVFSHEHTLSTHKKNQRTLRNGFQHYFQLQPVRVSTLSIFSVSSLTLTEDSQ